MTKSAQSSARVRPRPAPDDLNPGSPYSLRADWDRLGNPLASMLLGADDALRWSFRCLGIQRATHTDPTQIAQLRERRLAALLQHSRRHSPLMQRRLAGIPDDTAIESLPITPREELMASFDEWVTDPSLRLEELRAFIASPDRAGEPYLGRYAVWTSSGTSGTPGIYVTDPDALAVYEALTSARSACGRAAPTLWQAMLGGSRIALIAATTGHFAGFVTWERMRRLHPWLELSARTFSILEPLDQIVAELNEWDPAMISSYPSLLAMLADERRAGRLNVRPKLLMSGGETLPLAEAHALARTFECPVHDEYGASECMNIAWSCEQGALHLNADWVILEPVDDQMRVVPAGTASTDVLITNLMNHVQPIIRYPLGDRVTLVRGDCECGCPLPRIRVNGRHDDVIRLPGTHGQRVGILPLALETLVEEQPGIGSFQVVQTASDQLAVRIRTAPSVDRTAAWHALEHRLLRWLAVQGVHARLTLDPTLPELDPRTGKLRRVITPGFEQGSSLSRASHRAVRPRPRSGRGSRSRLPDS
ncbi:MAG: hypothetical protein RL322_1897 [Pseudomonadota bacterium]